MSPQWQMTSLKRRVEESTDPDKLKSQFEGSSMETQQEIVWYELSVGLEGKEIPGESEFQRAAAAARGSERNARQLGGATREEGHSDVSVESWR